MSVKLFKMECPSCGGKVQFKEGVFAPNGSPMCTCSFCDSDFVYEVLEDKKKLRLKRLDTKVVNIKKAEKELGKENVKSAYEEQNISTSEYIDVDVEINAKYTKAGLIKILVGLAFMILAVFILPAIENALIAGEEVESEVKEFTTIAEQIQQNDQYDIKLSPFIKIAFTLAKIMALIISSGFMIIGIMTFVAGTAFMSFMRDKLISDGIIPDLRK